MQNEFDKEIHALLKKAVKGDIIATPSAGHLDADEISMYAENALAGGAKDRATVHMADCNRCREILVSVVELNAEEGIEFLPVATAAPVQVVETETTTSVWSRLFSVRNLAMGFGALTLVFAGFLGFTAWNSSQSGVEMAQADKTQAEDKAVASSPSPPTESNDSADGDAKDSLTEADIDSESSELVPETATEPGAEDLPETRQNRPVGGASKSEAKESDRSAMKDAPKPSLRPDGLIADRDEAERKPPVDDDSGDATRSVEPVSESREEVLTTRGANRARNPKVPAPIKKQEANKTDSSMRRRAGVAKAKPPTQFEKAFVRRTISGKTFEKRPNGWFDLNYKGQKPTVVIRGTVAYGNLDAGLRSIGNRLPGTVFVIWKSKAYKIQ